MQENTLTIPKSHDLVKLMELLGTLYPELLLLAPGLKALSFFAVEFRYPGASATKEIATQAYNYSSLVREAVRRILKATNGAKARQRSKKKRAG